MTTTNTAWKNYLTRQNERDDAKQKMLLFGEIDYSEIINAAEDWLYYRDAMFQARVKNGFRKGDECWLPSYPDVDFYCTKMDAAYDKLSAICSLTHVSIDAAIKAAKVRTHHYEDDLSLYDICCDPDFCGKALLRLA